MTRLNVTYRKTFAQMAASFNTKTKDMIRSDYDHHDQTSDFASRVLHSCALRL
jgi:hypothetical protein